MRNPVTFLPATPADAAELAANIRPADAREMFLHSGMGPADGVAFSCWSSDVVLAARVGGRLFALFGGLRASLLSDTGTIWALGTAAIDASPRDFIAHSREGLRQVMDAMPEIKGWENWVIADNLASRRWLTWLGAWWSREQVATPSGAVFLHFRIER